MEIRPEFLSLVLACALVTAVPRVLPLVLLARFELPAWLLGWLRFVPVAVLGALTGIEVLMPGGNALSLHLPSLAGVGAAFAVAAVSRSLLATVAAGVALYWLLS
ncbi:MAG TPA: AzlD domain-containing protein [Burkholderiales bacterium]|nr:AzlD domain-containing protein [Burkholderiales bacterium]